MMPTTVFAATWYDSDWSYAKKITIDSTQVDSTLSDFPLLVNYTSTDVGTNAQSDCDDILFTDNANVTKYPHEIENCDLTTNDWFTAWINIPSISSSVDTDIFLYYGNSTVTSQENVTGTWNSNYEAVWHLHDDFLDSTSNNYDGTNQGSSDNSGHIADGQDFDGTNDYIDVGTINHDIGTSDFTWSVWMDMAVAGTWDGLIVNGVFVPALYAHVGGTSNSWGIYWAGSYPAEAYPHILSEDTPYYLVVQRNGTTIKFFEDGVQTANTFTISTSMSNSLSKLGTEGASSGFYEGMLDEARMITVALSADWVDAEYNNQKESSTFLTIGEQGTESGGGGTSFTRNITDELGLEDSVQTMVGLVISITDELGLEDNASVGAAMIVRNVTDELGLEDLTVVMLENTIDITDELGLEDSVQVVITAIIVIDELGLEDSVEYDIVRQIFNAIKLYLAPPASDRLGGVFAQSCAGGFYVSGINTTGNIVCTVLP